MKLLHFANFSSKPLHIGLVRKDGRIEIHVYDEPDPTRIEIPSMRRVPVDVTPDIDACIVDGKLQYGIEGHCGGLELAVPTTSKPDGPVFRFFNAEARG